MAVNIPLVQVDTRSDFSPPALARLLNQIQRNIIDGINKLQASIANAGTVVGQEITAYLTESQFQQQMGTGWVLADGRNIAGSAFAKLYGSNTLPNRCGTVSRMKDNGRGLDPAGDLPLGAYEDDTFASHTHIQDPHNHTPPAGIFVLQDAGTGEHTIAAGATTDTSPVTADTTATNQNTGSAETRVKAVIANVFIRIN